MSSYGAIGRAMRLTLIAGALSGLTAPAFAQDDDDEEDAIDVITVTGTRIQNQNVVAASPITTIDALEIQQKQTPNIERVFRDLPITIPGDGENVNNGTAGQATIDLRGLGPERMLVLIDGKRLTPYDINGIVSTDVIPVNMLQRVDVVTGGASAVYGSDALSGAVNFIMRNDFEGFEFDAGYSEPAQGEHSYYMNALFGVAFDDDRGSIVVGGGRTTRGTVLLADRSFGQFGVSSTTGSGLGAPPPAPSPDCSGNTTFTTAHSSGVGSTTAIPATLNLRSGNSYQFRDDGSLQQGECARFNFNPFNYYQTPQERWQSTALMSYNPSDNVEIYARASFSANSSDFQIAPSGTFGTAFTIPVLNPFFSDATRTTIIDDLTVGAANFVTTQQDEIARLQALPNPTQEDLDALAATQAALAADPNGFLSVGIQDINDDGIFDTNDAFTSTARRRTVELGARTGVFDTDYNQLVFGVRGSLPGNLDGWNFDLSYQRGESDFVETRDGFTNLGNLQAGINTVDPNQCIDLNGNVTAAPCTPINVFGPLGSITQAQRDSGFFVAIASDVRKTVQTIYHGSIDGTFEQVSLPWADDGLSVAFGAEFREESASSEPDECLKEAPASCQGGAGGNRLPIRGEFSADEYFFEAILPLVQDRSGFENVSFEGGWRASDFNPQGTTDSWKAGISWEVVPGFRFRFMEQQATRVANVGELFSPITTGLDNATLDPCSIGNPNPPAPGSDLFNLCVQTGQLPSQVGQTPDIIAGQINVFTGTNPANPPEPETARTRTVGFVWETDLAPIASMQPTTISLDYYDIEISDYIDTPTGQEALDLCYVLQDPVACSGIVRIGGAFGETGTGVPANFTNFETFQAEGIDLSVITGFDLGGLGDLGVNFTAHQYLTNEFQTTAASPVVDCKGIYGTSCDPVPEYRHTLRFNWARSEFNASLLWRRIGEMDVQSNEASALFPEFRSVNAQDYFDLALGYNFEDWARVSLLITNIADEDPPILGNETGSTSFNSGNTFPSLFDTMGRIYSVNLNFAF